MAPPISLTGITWNHSRGLVPMVATAQRFAEEHPDVEIVWQKRSLQEFADFPIEKLAETFDLLVIDHPFVGFAAHHPVLLPLDEYLPAEFLADQAANAVGKSNASYIFASDGHAHQWALAIDAAAPVSSYRPDLLAHAGVTAPATWTELLDLARLGRVALPAIPVDSLMHFYMLCGGLGEDPFGETEVVVAPEAGVAALEQLRELVSLCAPECFARNPIATYEAMVAGDAIAYCPFAYGYSNYARPGYARTPLQFAGLVLSTAGIRLRSTLGGTGLAISRSCAYPEVAAEYAQYVASSSCQRGTYFASGGQPGDRRAWLDPEINAACGNFFLQTLETLDEAYLRPRYDGYLHFQERAGTAVHAYLRDGGDAAAALERLNEMYRESQEAPPNERPTD